MNVIELEQGSQQWLDWRMNRRMASETPAVTRRSPYQNWEGLRRVKRGENVRQTAAMSHGHKHEHEAQDGEIEKYDNDKKARVKVVVPLFRELMDKPLGLLIQMEEYAKTAGGTAWKPVIAAAFDKDEFTASEILNKTVQPEALTKMVQALRDRPLKGATTSATGTFNSEVPADFDDVPF